MITYIGLDFGTLSLRGVSSSSSLKTERSYASQVVSRSDSGCFFSDPEEWVTCAKQVIDELVVREEMSARLNRRLVAAGLFDRKSSERSSGTGGGPRGEDAWGGDAASGDVFDYKTDESDLTFSDGRGEEDVASRDMFNAKSTGEPGSGKDDSLSNGKDVTSGFLEHALNVSSSGKRNRLNVGEASSAKRHENNPGDFANIAAISGIGIAFTSCTVLPIDVHGVPLSKTFLGKEQARVKMWKHHAPGVQRVAEELSALAGTKEILGAYGSKYGMEWYHAKVIEVFDLDVDVFRSAYAFVEAGDWVVWRLCGAKLPLEEHFVRSSQQAAYKACFVNGKSLMKSCIQEIRPNMTCTDLEIINDRLFTRIVAPGESFVGFYDNFNNTIPIAAACIDAHACALFLNCFNRLVCCVGTSGCYMISSDVAKNGSLPQIRGVAGAVPNGIHPNSNTIAFEFGQAAVGDAFAWFSKMCNLSIGALDEGAQARLNQLDKPFTVWSVDHFNGCRTPLMRGDVYGSFHGMNLETTSFEMYLALIESICFGIRFVVDMLLSNNVRLDSVALAGGVAKKSALFSKVLAVVLLPRQLDLSVYALDADDATARGAAAYAQMCNTNTLNTTSSVFDYTKSSAFELIKASPQFAQIVGSDERYARYKSFAGIQSYL